MTTPNEMTSRGFYALMILLSAVVILVSLLAILAPTPAPAPYERSRVGYGGTVELRTNEGTVVCYRGLRVGGCEVLGE